MAHRLHFRLTSYVPGCVIKSSIGVLRQYTQSTSTLYLAVMLRGRLHCTAADCCLLLYKGHANRSAFSYSNCAQQLLLKQAELCRMLQAQAGLPCAHSISPYLHLIGLQ